MLSSGAAGISTPKAVAVMSQNLYLGADLAPAMASLDSGAPATVISTVTQLWKDIRATNFPERATVLAKEIAKAHPDLIGLQEVELFRSGIPDSILGNRTKASHVEQDYLQILLASLKKLGQSYKVVAVTTEADIEAPGFVAPGVLKDIRLTDRDVILARADRRGPTMTLSNVQKQNFVNELTFTVGTTTYDVPRGWNSVDVQASGGKFRFINTHLETDSITIQTAQAGELLAGPASVNLPVIMVGDFNSPADRPGSPTYSLLVGAGFQDAWTQTHPNEPGYTWGNQADLRNPVPLNLDPQRIDLVLYKGAFSPQCMQVVGTDSKDRTRSGLWPSDHAGVVATLDVPIAGLAAKRAGPSKTVSSRVFFTRATI